MLESFEARLRSEIVQRGPMPFDEFVERALYDSDHGFYSTVGRAGGRRGDFLTSVEVGPLFAAVISDWLDAAWLGAGAPAQFFVTEVGAGVGTLFRGIHRAVPRCFDALVYTLVERSPAMQVAHQSLPSERWRSSPDIPIERQHVILANELLDNLPFGIAERTASGWAAVHVEVDADSLVLAPADPDAELDYLDELNPGLSVGDRVPTAGHAVSFVQSATRRSDRVLLFDYAATTAELGRRGQRGWLRTYAAHVRGSNPLDDVGERDITYDVPIDQLPPPTSIRSQADWLQTNGLPRRVELARAVWAERAHIGDLPAIAARSAISEAEALIDPEGLGGFSVLEWG